MKNNQFTVMLVGMLLLSVLASVGLMFGWQYFFKRLETDQRNLGQANEIGGRFQNLYAESAQYANSAKNQELIAILNARGMQPQPAVKAAK
jgi:hypothetical protein